jgi:hypothetical protein
VTVIKTLVNDSIVYRDLRIGIGNIKYT